MISKTALLCALARAAYTHGYNKKNNREKIFEDEFALDFVSLKEYRHAYKFAKELFPGTRFPTKNLLDEYFLPIVLPRNRFAEDIVDTKQKTGDVQYVLLGAGLDSFALRNKSQNVDVFELDLYETQVFKIERMRELFTKRRPKVHFVEIDFNKDSIIDRLMNAGFNPKKRSVFSILGVSYYIPIEIFFKTISQISQIAATNSVVVFDYYEKERNSADSTTKIRRLKQIAAACGERMADGYDPAQVVELAKKSGIKYCHDLTPKDLDEAFFKDSTELSAFEGVHLIYCGL
jgi:methyltransferase (TIGR00027 family)